MYGIDEGKLVEITSKPAFYSTITFESISRAYTITSLQRYLIESLEETFLVV